MILKFNKSARILHKDEFQSIYRADQKFIGQSILVFSKRGLSPEPRLGITVTRRHGKAVLRNRFKRCVREAFRLLYPTLPAHLEMVVHPRYEKMTPHFKEIFHEMQAFISDSCFVKTKPPEAVWKGELC